MATISEAFTMAVQHYQTGQLLAAEQTCQQILAINPEHAGALHLRGVIVLQMGKHELAVEYISLAIGLIGTESSFHCNLGYAFQAQGKQKDAVRCYLRALELDPSLLEARNNLGNALGTLGRLDEALACYRQVLEIKSDFAEAHNNVGNVLQLQGKLNEAVASYRRSLEVNPDNAEAHSNLGAALKAQGKHDVAVACCRRAIELNPNYAEAHNILGNVLKDQGFLDEAIACFRRALERNRNCFAAHSSLLYILWFAPSFDSAAIYEEHCKWYRHWAEPLAKNIAPHLNDATRNRKLRIGYVSPDFRNHCLSLFLVPLFAPHDRQQFEIVCYADVANPDNVTSRLRSGVDQWRGIVGLNDEEVAQMIRQDQIDILVDLTMHMERGHLLVFARKPAPVQVCWLAYPGTTGLKAIDFRLTDPYLDPPGLNVPYYAEKSVRLRDCFWCYEALTDGPAVNTLPAQSNGDVTFGCLNNTCKVNAGVLQLWARVLSAVKRSRLLLLAPEGSARENVIRILESAGILADRITFVAKQPRLSYLELYNQIDIGLDTFPYNGHTTSLDSFWMGVPVVTLVGNTVVGRAGLCQLHNLGLPELVAHGPEQFVDICVRLANDLRRLSQLRATLRERMEKSPLMDAPRFARSIEAAYRSMWHEWCASQRSSSLELALERLTEPI